MKDTTVGRRQLLKWLIVVIVAIVAIEVGRSVQRYWPFETATNLKLANVYDEQPGMGGSDCITRYFFFDPDGNLIDPISSYTGLSPIYAVAFCQPGPTKPYKISDVLDNDPIPFYPLLVKTHAIKKWIRSGESLVFELEATFPENFEYGSLPVLYYSDYSGQILLKLSATNFNISPAELEPQEIYDGIPLVQQWVISPKQNAIGNQYLALSVEDAVGFFRMTQSISLEVRGALGISPATAAILSALTTFAIGLLAFAKQIPEMMKTVLELRAAKKQDKPKRGTKNKTTSGK